MLKVLFTRLSLRLIHHGLVMAGQGATSRDSNSCHYVPQTEFMEWVAEHKGLLCVYCTNMKPCSPYQEMSHCAFHIQARETVVSAACLKEQNTAC